jgi:hypothetical protein
VVTAEPVAVRAQAALAIEPAQAAGSSMKATPAAVLELFTSEGCSSCPAADETLAKLTREAEAHGQRVFTLELHVDYWNYLGWTDPFSDKAYSQRQQAYSHKFPGSGVYTPQLVVNGQEELIGSNGGAARAAIARALQTPASAAVSVEAQRSDSGVELSYHVTSAHPVDLQLAVADDVAETHVTRGENADQLLKHRHVVRALRTLRLEASGSGKWSVPWPASKSKSAVFVAAFASDPSTLAVLGADARALTESR